MTHAADVHGPCHSEQNRRFTKGLIHDIIEFWDGERVGGLGGAAAVTVVLESGQQTNT